MDLEKRKQKHEKELKNLKLLQAYNGELWYCPTCEAVLSTGMTFPPADKDDFQICQRCLRQVFQEEPLLIEAALKLKIEQICMKLMVVPERQKELERTDPNIPMMFSTSVPIQAACPTDRSRCEFCSGTREMNIVGNVKVKCFCIGGL